MTKVDVTICGAGAFGTLTALALSEAGVKVCLLNNHQQIARSLHTGLGVVWPSPNDPPTRAVVAHGHDLAVYLYEYLNFGAQEFKRRFPEVQKCIASRVATKDFERVELEKAVEQQLALVKKSETVFLESNDAFLISPSSTLATQIEQTLQQKNVLITKNAQVTEIKETPSACTVTLMDGNEIKSEMVVVAMGYEIGDVMKQFHSILVPMTDVTSYYRGRASNTSVLSEAFAVRSHSGHVAFSFVQDGTDIHIRTSGPRFLLPQAGIGLDLNGSFPDDALQEKLKTFHRQIIFPMIENTLGLASENLEKSFQLKHVSSRFGVDCHPCDELPLVGSFGRQGKILGSSGWLATGFSAAAAGAAVMKDIILKGKSERLHPRLLPSRFDGI